MIRSYSIDDVTQLQVRRIYRDLHPQVSSGHLCEAIAYAQDFRSYAALRAAAKQVLPGQRQFAYFSRSRFAAYVWDQLGYLDGRPSKEYYDPLDGFLPYVHRAQGPEWKENGALIVYKPPRRLVECCKLVLREVAVHCDPAYREVLEDTSAAQYEKACRTFFQQGTLLEAVDEMRIGRSIPEGGWIDAIGYNFTNDSFRAGINKAQERFNGLDWVMKELACQNTSFLSLWALGSARFEPPKMTQRSCCPTPSHL